MSDKKVYYFSHDFNSKYDDKILSLRMEYGWEGYGIFWAIIEDLAQSKDYKLHNSVITKLSFSYNIDINKLKNIYNLCLKEKLLIEENEYFFSESLVKRMNALDETIKKRSEAGKKGMANRWNNKEKKENNNNVITKLKESYNDDITLKESKGKELKESKGKELKESKGKELKESKEIKDTLKTLWNDICISLPKILNISETRNKKIKLRFAEIKDIEVFKQAFLKIEKSNFCKGENKNNWKASFDWIIDNDTNIFKVLEGKYDNKKDYWDKIEEEGDKIDRRNIQRDNEEFMPIL